MSEVKCIVREPLLDAKEKVLGYELVLQGSDAAGETAVANESAELIAFVSGQLNDPEKGWLLGDSLIFLNVTPDVLSTETLSGLPPKNTVLTLNLADFSSADAQDAVKTLHAEGYGISLRNADLEAQDKAQLAMLTHIEVSVGSSNFASQARMFGALKQSSPLHMVVREIGSWQEFDSCAALGLDAFAGNLYLTPRSGSKSKGLNPAQVMILQLMELVRKNADIRQLEGILKRDAALSYKLLRYINSVGFGLGAEIQSLKHAVTMLGYSPLYRWLSLLLATASNQGHSPILMQTAVIRGRFAELLGKGFLPKNEAENLFVAGMFSLLDRLLGIPMAEVLESLQLSEPVEQALLSRDGMYGPFLALAEACESNQGNVAELADALFISPLQVNQAHMEALVWAQSLKL